MKYSSKGEKQTAVRTIQKQNHNKMINYASYNDADVAI